jgi:hypothetical protein
LHSPIALQEFDAQKYREFFQTLSDEAPIKEGKQGPLAVRRRKNRLDDAERVSRAVEDLPGGEAKTASDVIARRETLNMACLSPFPLADRLG